MKRVYLSGLAFSGVAALVVGCGGAGATGTPALTGSPSVTGSAAATSVNVTLAEWSLGTSVATAKAGAVKFIVKNDGPDDMHEFVVIKTDLSLIALPTDATGAVNEEAGGMTVEDEIEDILVGETKELTRSLQPGAYVLICNIYDDTEQESHYKEGMRNSFTVTP